MGGIDISKHNGKLDFAKLKKNGIGFVIIRAGYGGIVDPMFRQYINAAKKAGMLVGVYWFCYALNEKSAEKEAELCLDTIRASGCKPELPIFYDLEYDSERYARDKGAAFTNQLRTDMILSFCRRIEAGGYTAGVYTNPDYWRYRLDNGRLRELKLWIAAYLRNNCTAEFEAYGPERIPSEFRQAMIWQFGKCRLDGGNGYIDINYGYDLGAYVVKNAGYAIGDKYTLKENDRYSNGWRVPKRLVGKSFTISAVREGKILLAEIKSWVRV